MDPFNDYQQIIINSLNEMLSNNKIDKETAEVLKPKNVKPQRTILLITHTTQKEHRWKACDLTNKLSHYKIITMRCLPYIATKVKSYIRDTTDFINKLQIIDYVLHNAILATLYVKSLYSNINHKEVLLALEKYLDNRTH